jgi:hypothetical protein
MLNLAIRELTDPRNGPVALPANGKGFNGNIDLNCCADFTVTGRGMPAPLIIADLD